MSLSPKPCCGYSRYILSFVATPSCMTVFVAVLAIRHLTDVRLTTASESLSSKEFAQWDNCTFWLEIRTDYLSPIDSHVNKASPPVTWAATPESSPVLPLSGSGAIGKVIVDSSNSAQSCSL